MLLLLVMMIINLIPLTKFSHNYNLQICQHRKRMKILNNDLHRFLHSVHRTQSCIKYFTFCNQSLEAEFFCEYVWFLIKFHPLKMLNFEQMSADIKFHTGKCLILILLTEKLSFLQKMGYRVAIIFKYSSLYPLAVNIKGLIRRCW